jgi:glycosyltransferase involved in cell wall biosynthesis
MKVIALTRTTPIGPSTRYRIDQYRPRLAAHGIDVQLRPLFGPTWFRILEQPAGLRRTLAKGAYSLARLAVRLIQILTLRAARPDLVLIEQQLFPYLPVSIETLLWPRRLKTALEFDDAIYLTAGHRTKLEQLCARADVVIVGNEFLANFARQHAHRVRVIPTTVDLTRYKQAQVIQRARRDENDSTLRVAWIGLRYNFPFLENLARPLAQLAAEGTKVELRVISSGSPKASSDWGDVRIVHRPWSEETEAAELGTCDLSVMPLPDTEWARGKCGLKVLQSMAAAVPVICSPVGVNAEIVKNGINGLLADGDQGWHEALTKLAQNLEYRKQLGESGLRTVETSYNLINGAEQLLEAYGLASLPVEEVGNPTNKKQR